MDVEFEIAENAGLAGVDVEIQNAENAGVYFSEDIDIENTGVDVSKMRLTMAQIMPKVWMT